MAFLPANSNSSNVADRLRELGTTNVGDATERSVKAQGLNGAPVDSAALEFQSRALSRVREYNLNVRSRSDGRYSIARILGALAIIAVVVFYARKSARAVPPKGIY